MNTFVKHPIPVLPPNRRLKVQQAMTNVTDLYNVAAGHEKIADDLAKADFFAWRKGHPEKFETEVKIDTSNCYPMKKLQETGERLGRALALHNLARRLEAQAAQPDYNTYGQLLAGDHTSKRGGPEVALIKSLLTDRNWVALARLAIAHVMIVGIDSTTFDKNLTMAWASVGLHHREYFKSLAKQLHRMGIPQTDSFMITGDMQRNWKDLSLASKIAWLTC
jgi:hypothetical protein